MIHPGIPALILAPMEGVTDAPMRALLSELGGFTSCVTEFLRISAAVPGVKVFWRHAPELLYGGRTPAGAPVQVQLLGGDADKLAQAACAAVAAGARAVDLNFGCPARTVNRHDGGATLLQHPERIRAIVTAVRQAAPATVPVSAKLRLGWDDMRAIHVNAERAAEGGAQWLTIHARTKLQGYRPPAYWAPLREVRARLGIPVVANGEIWTIDDLRRCRDVTGCEHFMLGRGALADPGLVGAAARELGIAIPESARAFTGTREDWLHLLRRYAVIGAMAGLPPWYVAARIKQWLRLAQCHGKLHWFHAVKCCRELAEMFERLDELAGPHSHDAPPFPTGVVGSRPSVAQALPK